MLGNDCKHQNKNISKFNPTLLYVQFNVQYSEKLVPGLKSEKGVGEPPDRRVQFMVREPLPIATQC